MKLLNKTWAFALLSSLVMVGCSEMPEGTTIDPTQITASSLKAVPTDVIALENFADGDVVGNIEWTAASYGFDAAIIYSLEIFNDEVSSIVCQTSALSAELLAGDMNVLLASTFGFQPGEEATLNLRIKSTIGAEKYNTVSNVSTISFVLPAAAPDPIPLYAVGGFNGWNHSNDISIWSANCDGIYEGWLPLLGENCPADAETMFKFTPEQNWDTDFGSVDGNIENLQIKGTDIKLMGGTLYFVKINTNDLKGEVVRDDVHSIGIIGSSIPPYDWSADIDMNYDVEQKLFIATGVAMKPGEFKFRCNDKWDISWGTVGVEGEVPLQPAGNNIPFNLAEGNYTIKLDLFKIQPTYEFIAE